MEGYEVIDADDRAVGHVVETRGDNLIVEHGKLRKSRHALPRVFAHVDDATHTVRITVSRQILEDSPKAGAELDEQAVAEHYGLASASPPGTEGYGEMMDDEPAFTAEEDRYRAGDQPAAAERAEIREQMQPGADQGAPSGRLQGSRRED